MQVTLPRQRDEIRDGKKMKYLLSKYCIHRLLLKIIEMEDQTFMEQFALANF